MTSFNGWGHATPSRGHLRVVDGSESYRGVFDGVGSRGVVPRGLGRSYGDAAQNSGGCVLDTTVGARVHEFDRGSGTLIADGGVSLHEIERVALPAGRLPSVLPGTAQVTLGGAIAADVHGKNHLSAGSFSAQVSEIDLGTPAGGIRIVGPGRDPGIFWATVGGMGLTGIISRVALRLSAVETGWMLVRDGPYADLDALLAGMTDTTSPYAVAWIDAHASGKRLGRGVLSRADHAGVEDLPAAQRRIPLLFGPDTHLRIPPLGGRGPLRNTAIGAYNTAAHLRSRHPARGRRVQHVRKFFHPLDSVSGWPSSFGRAGLIQYQFAVPYGAEHVLRSALRRLQTCRQLPSLVVLKRLGAAGKGHLSFPIPGWTLALDLPGHRDLGPVLDSLDEQVADAGGRVYLAKDARLRGSVLSAMYPRLEEWRAVRDRLDPGSVLTSDLDRRIGLTGRPVP